jgi:predicted nicotinamide N-methyase
LHSEIRETDQDRPLRVVTFAHRGVVFRLTLPRCADELIDEHAFANDERLPYWADLWPSARALARFLLDHPPAAIRVDGSGAIELGCGATALPSIALACQGTSVLATDYEPEALESANINIADNRCAINGQVPRVVTRLLDWRDPQDVFDTYGLVLAADVMYEQRNAVALAETIPRLIVPGGRFILADPGRRYLPEFQARMRQRGWLERELAISVEPGGTSRHPPSHVRIIEFAPSSRT